MGVIFDIFLWHNTRFQRRNRHQAFRCSRSARFRLLKGRPGVSKVLPPFSEFPAVYRVRCCAVCKQLRAGFQSPAAAGRHPAAHERRSCRNLRTLSVQKWRACWRNSSQGNSATADDRRTVGAFGPAGSRVQWPRLSPSVCASCSPGRSRNTTADV